LNGPEFDPSLLDYAALPAEEEELFGLPAGSLPAQNWCVDSTNPLCPDKSDFRNL